MGMVRSALPELPVTFTGPDANHPASMGVPRRRCTRASFCALSSASLYASVLFIEPITTNTRQATNAAKSAMTVRHPTGANHFQLRDHHPGCCGGTCIGDDGGRMAGGVPIGPPLSSLWNLRVGLEHLLGVLQRCVRDLRAGEHARDLFGAFLGVEPPDAGARAALRFPFLDGVVLVGEGSDLRQMRDAEHLLGARERFEFLAHGFGGAPAD